MVKMRNLLYAGLWAVSAPAPASAEPGYTEAERALVTALFIALQPRSVAWDIEYCGYVVRDAEGHLHLTGPYSGREHSCKAPWPQTHEALASWHTHGSFDANLWNEVPSARDLQADAFEGVDGWVATPGGRLWHIDGQAMVASLVCGPFCLPGDPDYDRTFTGDIAERYSFDALLDKFTAE